MEITNANTSLTTMIFKTSGIPVGSDYINQAARQHAESCIEEYRHRAPPDVRELLSTESFQRAVEAWWHEFEEKWKRDLKLASDHSILDKIIHVPTPGLMNVIDKASRDLALRTRDTIERLSLNVELMTQRKLTVSVWLCSVPLATLT